MSYIKAAAGTLKIGGALLQGRADKMNANTNAMMADYQAQQEEEAAQQQAAIIRRAGMYATARETASYAASGVAVDSGSATEVVNQTRTDATHDAYMAILTGKKRGDALRAGGAIGAAQAQGAADMGVASAVSSTALSIAGQAGKSGWSTAPAVTSGSNPNGYNGTMNNPSAYVAR